MREYLNKLIFWVRAHKLFSALIVIVLLVLLYFVFSRKTLEENPLIPRPSESPSSTRKPLVLVNRTPSTDTFKSIWPSEPLIFTFDESLNSNSIKYSLVPETTSRIVFDKKSSNTFTILPLTGWEENISYTITVSKELSSVTGRKLEKDIVIKLTRLLPEPGDPEYPDEIEENY